MRIHPELRALRGNDAPQRDAQEALYRVVGAWREQDEIGEVLKDLASLDSGTGLGECQALSSLFTGSGEAAKAFVQGFVRAVSAGLGDAPLGHVPLRHFTDGTSSTLLLARSGNVTLSLVAIDGDGFACKPDPVTADFSPSEVWERVLAGKAQADLIDLKAETGSRAELAISTISIEAGATVHRDRRRQTCLLRAIEGRLVFLRLQRRLTDSGPSREYDLSDGRTVHQAAGNPRDSRIELMMALLGRMQRTDAAPILGEIAREEGTTALRWQALRECLALDTLEGFSALTAIARSPGDDLAPAAGALRSQLIETYPQLGELELCHA